MFAQMIHRLSSRSEESFIKMACASMNRDRMSAELSLGASGKPQAAGTVFLDEISELDAACQRILLYALPDEDSRQDSGRSRRA